MQKIQYQKMCIISNQHCYLVKGYKNQKEYTSQFVDDDLADTLFLQIQKRQLRSGITSKQETEMIRTLLVPWVVLKRQCQREKDTLWRVQVRCR